MSWRVDRVTRAGSHCVDEEGNEVVLGLVNAGDPGALTEPDSLTDFLAYTEIPPEARALRERAQLGQLVEVLALDSGGTCWLDWAASPQADDLVAKVKQASAVVRDTGRLLVVAGLVAVGPDDDYDSLPALGAAMIRLRVDQWLGVGLEAKALATQVGLEGSWGGESLWLDSAATAYDYVRAWPSENDLVLIIGHRFGELPGVLELMGVTP
ncbi:MAG: hypothetical protein WD400_01305 [Pontimonas sp.]